MFISSFYLYLFLYPYLSLSLFYRSTYLSLCRSNSVFLSLSSLYLSMYISLSVSISDFINLYLSVSLFPSSVCFSLYLYLSGWHQILADRSDRILEGGNRQGKCLTGQRLSLRFSLFPSGDQRLRFRPTSP